MKKILIKPENIFLILCLLWGSTMMIINPPFQTPDEAQHFFKMYGFTNGTFNFKVLNKHTGDLLPESIIKISKFEKIGGHQELKTTKTEITEALKIKLEKNKTKFYKFTPTGYTPVSYFPSFLVLWIMKLLNTPPLIMMYMLRLCSLFLYTGLIYQAIKIMPAKKWLFALLALMPMTLYEASSVSTDALTTGLAFLFIAYALKLALDKNIKKISKNEFIIFGFLLTFTLICKYAYFPLILLYFCIPKEKFNTQKTRYLYFFTLFLLNIFITGIYILHILSVGQNVISGTPGYDRKFMIGFILNRFSWFLDFFWQTVKSQWSIYLYSYIGLLGCNDTFLNVYLLKGFILILITAGLFKTDKKEAVFDLKMKFLFLISFLASFVIILTSAFILFQCYPVFCGIQGRYFIPVMPLLFFLLDNKKWSWRKMPIYLIIGTVILMPFVLGTLINRFYL